MTAIVVLAGCGGDPSASGGRGASGIAAVQGVAPARPGASAAVSMSPPPPPGYVRAFHSSYEKTVLTPVAMAAWGWRLSGGEGGFDWKNTGDAVGVPDPCDCFYIQTLVGASSAKSATDLCASYQCAAIDDVGGEHGKVLHFTNIKDDPTYTSLSRVQLLSGLTGRNKIFMSQDIYLTDSLRSALQSPTRDHWFDLVEIHDISCSPDCYRLSFQLWWDPPYKKFYDHMRLRNDTKGMTVWEKLIPSIAPWNQWFNIAVQFETAGGGAKDGLVKVWIDGAIVFDFPSVMLGYPFLNFHWLKLYLDPGAKSELYADNLDIWLWRPSSSDGGGDGGSTSDGIDRADAAADGAGGTEGKDGAGGSDAAGDPGAAADRGGANGDGAGAADARGAFDGGGKADQGASDGGDGAGGGCECRMSGVGGGDASAPILISVLALFVGLMRWRPRTAHPRRSAFEARKPVRSLPLLAWAALSFLGVWATGCVDTGDPETDNGADAGSERKGGSDGSGGQGGGSGGPDRPGDGPGSDDSAGADGAAPDGGGGGKGGSGGGGGGSAELNPPYPRLGAYPISSPKSYDKPATQAHWAKYHVVIFGQWPGWEKGRLLTMAESVEAVKKLSPHVPPTRVFEYVNNNEQDPGDTVRSTLVKKLDAMGWWLYKAGASGARVPGTWNPSWLIINNTVLGPVDAAGKNSVVWMADWYKSWNVDGAESTAPNPHWDGFFLDNVFWRPRVDGDWNRDGKTDPKTDPATQKRLREGQKAWVDRLRATWPGSLQLGNIADWPQASATDDPAAIAPMSGVLDGGVMEGLIGESWSVENRGFAEMMRYYRYMLDNTRPPRLVIFGDRPGSYQNMRYGLAACLMDEAYYYPAEGGYSPDSRLWYDEFDNAGAGVGYLGHPTELRRSGAWSKGVWRRDFDKGIVLVNPKGNGTQTVDLGGTSKKIAGKQAPSVNSGASVTSVTLLDRDGLILLKP